MRSVKAKEETPQIRAYQNPSFYLTAGNIHWEMKHHVKSKSFEIMKQITENVQMDP